MCSVEGVKDGWVRARIAGLKAKKGQVVIIEDADRKEVLLSLRIKTGENRGLYD